MQVQGAGENWANRGAAGGRLGGWWVGGIRIAVPTPGRKQRQTARQSPIRSGEELPAGAREEFVVFVVTYGTSNERTNQLEARPTRRRAVARDLKCLLGNPF